MLYGGDIHSPLHRALPLRPPPPPPAPAPLPPSPAPASIASPCISSLQLECCPVCRAAAVIATDKENLVERVKEITGLPLYLCLLPHHCTAGYCKIAGAIAS